MGGHAFLNIDVEAIKAARDLVRRAYGPPLPYGRLGLPGHPVDWAGPDRPPGCSSRKVLGVKPGPWRRVHCKPSPRETALYWFICS